MMIEDFTKLCIGSLVSMSRAIIRCPLCGRCGAIELRSNDPRRCVHVEASVINTDGMLVEPLDSCELAAAFASPPDEPLQMSR